MISQGLQVKSLGAVRRASLHQALSEGLRTAAEPLCGEYPGRIQSPGSAFCQVFFLAFYDRSTQLVDHLDHYETIWSDQWVNLEADLG